MPVVITFVHGTRVLGRIRQYDYSPWKALEDALAQDAQKSWGGAELRHFHWGGENSHSARRGASKALRAMLEDGLQKRPAALHYVIAHSHGGNIAAAAARPLSAHPHFRALITLATPFLFVSEAPMPRIPVIATVGWFSAIPLAAYALHSVLGAAVSLVVAIMVFGGIGLAFRWLAANAALVKSDLPSRLFPEDKLWIVRHSNDEAISFLKSGDTRSRIHYRLSSVISAAEPRLNVRGVDYAVYCATAVIFAALGLRQFGVRAAFLDSAASIAGYGLIGILFVAAGSAMVLGKRAAKLIRRRILALGFQLAAAAPFVQLAIEPNPPGRPIEKHLPETTAAFQHSETYRDPPAIEWICSQIADDVRAWEEKEAGLPEVKRHGEKRGRFPPPLPRE